MAIKNSERKRRASRCELEFVFVSGPIVFITREDLVQYYNCQSSSLRYCDSDLGCGIAPRKCLVHGKYGPYREEIIFIFSVLCPLWSRKRVVSTFLISTSALHLFLFRVAHPSNIADIQKHPRTAYCANRRSEIKRESPQNAKPFLQNRYRRG